MRLHPVWVIADDEIGASRRGGTREDALTLRRVCDVLDAPVRKDDHDVREIARRRDILRDRRWVERR